MIATSAPAGRRARPPDAPRRSPAERAYSAPSCCSTRTAITCAMAPRQPGGSLYERHRRRCHRAQSGFVRHRRLSAANQSSSPISCRIRCGRTTAHLAAPTAIVPAGRHRSCRIRAPCSASLPCILDGARTRPDSKSSSIEWPPALPASPSNASSPRIRSLHGPS